MKNLILLFCLMVMSALAFSQENVVMKGDAYDADNKLVYIETHNFKRLPTGERASTTTTTSIPCPTTCARTME